MAEANPEPSTADNSTPNTSTTDVKEESNRSPFECNICFDTAHDAVVSKCGHLYCWACIYQWINQKPLNPTCPVCKGAISKDTLTPIYGKSGNQSDPRNEAPPRPQGQREESPQQNTFFGGPFGNELTFQIGIGAFPFGLFTNFGPFNYPGPHGQNRQQQQHPEAEQERTLSKIFIYIAIVFIIWVLY
ncbi:hypothetical protein LOD99_13665 [Oopsacas minuta]|uniref:RING-type E3 ubiquitin transferase n=1 Tax=Oopsacas minuta TaxID=111878 RepID=A0AAV7KMG4_9METZ|nr:hypothetical protein LOD99_13665 [Oopsacas minuta]